MDIGDSFNCDEFYLFDDIIRVYFVSCIGCWINFGDQYIFCIGMYLIVMLVLWCEWFQCYVKDFVFGVCVWDDDIDIGCSSFFSFFFYQFVNGYVECYWVVVLVDFEIDCGVDFCFGDLVCEEVVIVDLVIVKCQYQIFLVQFVFISGIIIFYIVDDDVIWCFQVIVFCYVWCYWLYGYFQLVVMGFVEFDQLVDDMCGDVGWDG